MKNKKTKILTIGGGSGQYTLLSGLRDLENIEITSVVSMADNGGSTGRLRDELGILPPTYVNLLNLSRYDDLAQMLDGERESPAPEIMPVIGNNEGGDLAVMFPGDAGYDSGDGCAAGARHRVVLHDSRWEYLYCGNPAFPCMAGAELSQA